MCRVRAGVPPDFFEIHNVNAAGDLQRLFQPITYRIFRTFQNGRFLSD
jgi:hypothetical protein